MGDVTVSDGFERFLGNGMGTFPGEALVDFFYQRDVLDNVEIGEQGRPKAYRGDLPGVQGVVMVPEFFVVVEELYSDCSSNVNTSMVKMAMKSLTMPLSTEMGMSVIAWSALRPL